MRLFKYTEKRYAEDLLKGKIYIPNMLSYHNVGQLGEAIGDREEATNKQILTGQFKLGERELPHIGGVSGATIHINNSTFIHGFTDLYAFCVSTECSKKLMDKFSTLNIRAGKKPYDTCLEIENTIRFRRRLTRIAFNQHKLVFHTHGKCKYSKTVATHPVRKPRLEPRHFLEKPLEFKYQREYRFGLVLAMEVESVESYYVIDSPEIGSHFREIKLT